MTAASYRRTGGRRPRLDEELEIEPDGRFRLRRTVAVDRVGRFAGTVPEARWEALRAGLAELTDAGPLATPDADHPSPVYEAIRWDGGEQAWPDNAPLPDPWLRVRDELRALVDELVDQPVAALELTLAADGTQATLAAVGPEPVALTLSSVVSLSLFDEQDDYVDAASAGLPDTMSEVDSVPAGWHSEIPLAHRLPFSPARTLRASIECALDGRPAELTAFAGKGWTVG